METLEPAAPLVVKKKLVVSLAFHLVRMPEEAKWWKAILVRARLITGWKSTQRKPKYGVEGLPLMGVFLQPSDNGGRTPVS